MPANSSIGTTPAQLTQTPTPVASGTEVRAALGNTDNVYLGYSGAAMPQGGGSNFIRPSQQK